MTTVRKSIFYRLFGLGRLPKKSAPAFRTEGIVLLDEGLRGTVTLRGFRAPGRIHSYRKSLFVGSLVVTSLRFAGFALWRPIINVPLHDDRLAALDLSRSEPDLLCVEFDAAVFNPDHSGRVEIRFRTDAAPRYRDHVSAQARGAIG